MLSLSVLRADQSGSNESGNILSGFHLEHSSMTSSHIRTAKTRLGTKEKKSTHIPPPLAGQIKHALGWTLPCFLWALQQNNRIK